MSRHLNTRSWEERYFWALVSMSIVNTYKAYNFRRSTADKLPLHTVMRELAHKLLRNPYGQSARIQRPLGTAEINVHLHLPHSELATHPSGNNPKCGVCLVRKTALYCVTCRKSLCAPKKYQCYLKHILEQCTGDIWRDARAAVWDL